MKIERLDPLITVDQTIELVKLAVSSKTQELEKAVALCLKAIVTPPYIYNDSNVEQSE